MNTRYRYRLTFSKGYPVKYVAHLDVALAWSRAFRRAGLPLAYSGGFSPQPKIQVAASLPVGSMGAAELMDIYLTEPLSPADILTRVQNTLPTGFALHSVEPVPLNAPTLQGTVSRADYAVIVSTDLTPAELSARIAALLDSPEVIQTRIRRQKEETFNLRPLLHSLTLQQISGGKAHLSMQLAAGQHGNLRPGAVLTALGIDNPWYQAERTKLHLTFDS